MPALGKQKANINNDGNYRQRLLQGHDEDDDDQILLDDETRKMIMQDVQRGRAPVLFPTPTPSSSATQTTANAGSGPSSSSSSSDRLVTAAARGTGPSAASYLLNNNNSQQQQKPNHVNPPSLNHRRTIPVKQQQQQSSSSSSARGGGTVLQPEKREPEQKEEKEKEPPSAASTLLSLDPELIDVMASRLRFLEQQNNFLQKEVREKSCKLSDTQNRLSDSEEAVSKLQAERLVLAEKVASMSQFLADYNLHWVGEDEEKNKKKKKEQEKENEKMNNNPNDDSRVTTSQASSSSKTQQTPVFDLYSGTVNSNSLKNTNYNVGTTGTGGDDDDQKKNNEANKKQEDQEKEENQEKEKKNNKNKSNSKTKKHDDAIPKHSAFDFERFENNCEQLSYKVSQNHFQKNESNNTVVLRPREVIQVIVFADGITVQGGPFRPFGWSLCDAFVQDVLDGFFPYEFRAKYPEGFPIQVLDRRDQRYISVPSFSSQQQQQQHHGKNNNNRLNPMNEEDLQKQNPIYSSSSQNSTPTRQRNNNNNKNIRTLHDSPYTLRRHHVALGSGSVLGTGASSNAANGGGGGRRKQHDRMLNNNASSSSSSAAAAAASSSSREGSLDYDSDDSSSSDDDEEETEKKKSNKNKKKQQQQEAEGKILGGTRHPGVQSGNHVTRDLILKRMPSQFVTSSGKLINPAEGLREFLGLPPSTQTVRYSSSSSSSAQQPAGPHHQRLLELHQKEDEERKKQAQEHGSYLPHAPPPRYSLATDRQNTVVSSQIPQGAAFAEAANRHVKMSEQKRKFQEERDDHRLIRVAFPNGEQCDVVVGHNATVQELHDAILEIAPRHLTAPPVDLRQEAFVYSEDREESGSGMGRRVPTGQYVREMELHARFPNRSLGDEKHKSLSEVGLGKTETVLLKWKPVLVDAFVM